MSLSYPILAECRLHGVPASNNWVCADEHPLMAEDGYHDFRDALVELMCCLPSLVMIHHSSNGQAWLSITWTESHMAKTGLLRRRYIITPVAACIPLAAVSSRSRQSLEPLHAASWHYALYIRAAAFMLSQFKVRVLDMYGYFIHLVSGSPMLSFADLSSMLFCLNHCHVGPEPIFSLRMVWHQCQQIHNSSCCESR